MEKIIIQANLSIERCGGEENLEKVIKKTKTILGLQFPQAEISVRKGYFQTIDGFWSSDPNLEKDIRKAVSIAREQVLSGK